MKLLLIVIIGHLNLILSSCNFSNTAKAVDKGQTSDSSRVVYNSVDDTIHSVADSTIAKEPKMVDNKVVNKSLKIEKKQAKKTLREAYKAFFPIGTAIEPGLFKDKKSADFIIAQYSSVTPTNQMKPLYTQATEGIFTFSEADKIVKFAKSNNMKVRGHCLVWPLKMPEWIYKDGKNAASKEKVLARLKTHISTVVSHFKGDVYCWDVVNEAIAFTGKITFDKRKELLHEITSDEYIEQAFHYAHEADPSAKLFYNDNGFEAPEKRQLIFQYLKTLKSKGVPIHGVGLQGHWGIEGIGENYLQETIDMFNSIGLEVQITELDISIYLRRINGDGSARTLKANDLKNVSDVYTSDIADRQSKIYDIIFRVFRRNKGKVTGITFWSPYDRSNYLTARLNKKNYPYLFDVNFKPKKPFFSVVDF